MSKAANTGSGTYGLAWHARIPGCLRFHERKKCVSMQLYMQLCVHVRTRVITWYVSGSKWTAESACAKRGSGCKEL